MNNEASNQDRRRDEEWADDEISLVDLALILVRRKWWAIGTFVVVMVAGLGYVAMQPEPGYTAEAAVELMPVPEGMILEVERPDVMADIIEPVQVELDGGTPRIGISERGSQVGLNGQGKDAEALRERLETGVSEVAARVEEHWLPYARAAYETRQAEMDRLKERVLEIQSLAEEERDPTTLASLTAAEMAVRDRLDAEEKRAEDKGDLRDLLAAGKAGHLEDVRVVSEPSVQRQSRHHLIIALTFVLALMLGLFAAFFAEFLGNVRSRLNS